MLPRIERERGGHFLWLLWDLRVRLRYLAEVDKVALLSHPVELLVLGILEQEAKLVEVVLLDGVDVQLLVLDGLFPSLVPLAVPLTRTLDRLWLDRREVLDDLRVRGLGVLMHTLLELLCCREARMTFEVELGFAPFDVGAELLEHDVADSSELVVPDVGEGVSIDF